MLSLFTLVLLLDRLFPPDLSRYHTTSLELLDREGAPVQALLSQDGMWRLPGRPDAVAPSYLDLLIQTEDRRFWWHPGVDPLALARAAFQLATRGHIVSGGSTLTMQVARLLTPHRHTVKGKLLDVLRALQLEAHYGKTDILAMYLTLAPFGGNIEGIRAASEMYFDKPPSVLSEAEAAMMVALPRSPTRLRPDRHPERLKEAARTVLARAGAALPDLAAASAAMARHPPPAEAPHLAERLASAHLTGSIATTLEGKLQAGLVRLAAAARGTLDARAGIAIIVVDNRDRAVLGYLGGSDYFGPSGMVDMARAERSPGSTLKPLIYALAFDDTLVRPDTLIDDAPTEIDGYAPRNFDRSFHGAVTIAEALRQSYNIPAVQLMRAIGPARFDAMVRQAGARLVLPAGGAEPGVPIALGGVGISLEDLATLYVGLADDGGFAPLRLLLDQPRATPAQLLTRKAAREISAILREAPVPDGMSAGRTRPIAYKTGTSYGFHDAWAMGFSPEYTVGVWVGRPDGTSRPGALGRETAAPILFQVFDLLPEEAPLAPGAVERDTGTARVAPSLKHYRPDAGPRIIFPPAGAMLDAMGHDGTKAVSPVALEAYGGKPPYRWFVNGAPLAAPAAGNPVWRPSETGFARISVIDRRNEAVSETVRVQ